MESCPWVPFPRFLVFVLRELLLQIVPDGYPALMPQEAVENPFGYLIWRVDLGILVFFLNEERLLILFPLKSTVFVSVKSFLPLF